MGFPRKGIVTFGGLWHQTNKQQTEIKGYVSKETYSRFFPLGSYLPRSLTKSMHPPYLIRFLLFLITVCSSFQSTLAQIAIDWSGTEGYFVNAVC